MTAASERPVASLRVTRLVAVSLGLGGLILFVFDLSLVVGQARVFAPWWTVLSVVAVVGMGIAVGVIGALGGRRATIIAFRALAGAVLAVAVLALVALPRGGIGQEPWPADLLVIGAAAAGAGMPVPAAVGYLVALLGAFGAEALLVVVPAVRLDTLLHLCQSLFYAALIMAIAVAARRAGRLLDLAALSAAADAGAAAAADARRAQRRRVEGLIHDTVIVALLAFGRGTRDGDERAAREATRALAAIEELAGPTRPGDDPTPRELAWRLQAITTDLEAQIRFDYRAGEEGRIPAEVAMAVSEAMSEAVRNSLHHAGARGRVLRQITAQITEERVRVVVLDDGVGFDPAVVDPTRLGIREGMVGRMAHAGGRAEVVSRPQRGTTVVLEWSRR
jgi:two-component sensor histidine kinase